MAVTTLKIAGRKYVLMPESEFIKKTAAKNGAAKTQATRNGLFRDAPLVKRLTRQDRGDIAESLRSLKDPRRIPAEEVFRKLGL